MTRAADATAPRRRIWGRHKGKPLRARQRQMLEEFLPRVALPDGPLSARGQFGDDRPLWVEIGFGAGEHLLALAAANPGVGLIGAEHFVNGVASCLSHLERAGLGNVRIHHGDAHEMLARLPAGGVARIFLLYPDPWPKARHARRRFVNPEGIGLLARALAPGGLFHLATDIPGYVAHAEAQMSDRPEFRPVPRDIARPWEDWHRTRYEAKALREGRRPHYLVWQRI
ncbi:MAG: tRNA (guanosine(46)-N7)-methyltransferase TrmB [Alphaproteobacteria bacterium]|nr:MAG: tRNA (guanosine(46)-N7)-methyltransferase TrmB [Alphaproteobacteria bacterium]